MKKIVITGGPCGGKTSTLEALKQEFNGKIAVVPEAATLLLSGGFPVPGKDIEWSKEWQHNFQTAVTTLQSSLEQSYQLIAKQRGLKLLICDRGILDGAAYNPDGREEFFKRYQINEESAVKSYFAVIHLESLATAQPHLYGQGNNAHRFESLEEAQALELRIRQAWSVHPNHLIIENKSSLMATINQVIETIKSHL